MPGVVSKSRDSSGTASNMSEGEISRKMMNPSTEAQFFSLVKQLRENNVDEQRSQTIKTLSSMQNLQLSSKGVCQFRQECHEHLCGIMETLMQQQNKLWYEIWAFVVEQMGQDLHTDNKFLNSMLSVLEHGMKRKDSVSMRWSLSCWQILIDNFALSPRMISAPRRVSLLTIPLKAKNVKDLNVLEQKFGLWWHLLVSLREYIDLHTETVSKPLLLFTFGPFEQGSSQLLSKFPGAAKMALLFLTSFTATGVADDQLSKIPCDFKSSRPLIKDSKSFLCLAELIIKSINVLFKQPEELPVKHLEVLLSAVLSRITNLCKENSTFGGDILALFFKMLKDTLFGMIVLSKKYRELLLFTVERALETLPPNLMDTKLKNINHTSPRDFMFSLLCDKEHLLMHAKPSIQKTDERQCVILGKLLGCHGTIIAHPDRLANAKMLVDTLVEIQDMCQGEAAKKCFHLWEQCCRFLCKIPKDTPNEQCNQISQKIFIGLILMPFKLILTSGSADSLSSAVAENAVVKSLKTLFFLYSEIVYLSLSVMVGGPFGGKKEDPCRKIYQNITDLLTTEKYPPSTCQTLVKVISKFVVVRSSINYTKLFGKTVGLEAEMTELKLLAKLAGLLVALAPDSPQIAGKLSSYVAKALENLVLLVTSTEAIIEAIKIFYELLTKTPSAYWPNNRMEVTDPWDSLVSPFKRIWSSDKEELNAKMHLLLEIKPKIETLVNHSDIKVCNSAREMIGRYSKHENEESSNSADTILKSPTSTRMVSSRKRSFLMTQGSPVKSQISSPSLKRSPDKPSLEDLDSQDFVKIPSQPTMKKPLTPHQREVKRRRREDIPALYQGLSQDTQMSQDTQDEPPLLEIPKLPLNVPSSVWSEDAMDVDLTSKTTDESDENKSLNSQEELVTIVIEDDDNDLKKEKETQDIDIVENSQNYATIPLVPDAKPEIEILQVSRARNRQGVLLPTLKTIKEPETLTAKDSAPVNKRKSLPPVRGAGLKGRAAQMVGLATSKDTSADNEAKQPEVSAPVKVMSSLIAMSEAKSDEPVNANDLSPTKSITSNVSVTPLSSHRKRSNLKKDAETATPSPRQSKRVSFAEPVVSGQQDSPNILQDIQVYNNYYKQSPNTKKKMKASRKLLMAPKDGFQLIKEVDPNVSTEKLSSETKSLIEPLLVDCSVPVSTIVDKLASPSLVEELVCQLAERNIQTVHDLNLLSELTITELAIREPKMATVQTVFKLLKESESCKNEELDNDETTEIENLPLTQPETLPEIATVTTHADTVQVIEEVETPEDDSPSQSNHTPLVEALEEPMELPSETPEDNESPTVDDQLTSQEKGKTTQIIVESSLEPEIGPSKIIGTQDEDENVTGKENCSQEVLSLTEASQSPILLVKAEQKTKTAEETYAALSCSERQKLRKMILEESESQELIDSLQSRKENYLSSRSTSELLNEIKNRSCSSEVFELLGGTPEFQMYTENNTSLSQLMQKRSGEEIAGAMGSLFKQDHQKGVESTSKFLGSMKSTQLTEIFHDIEGRICDSLSSATLEEHVKKDPTLADSILGSIATSSVAETLANCCSKRTVSFTSHQACSIYPQIKKQVAHMDSTDEILNKLEVKVTEGSVSEVQIQARGALKKCMLGYLNQEEIVSQLDVSSEDQQTKISAKLANEDLLSMAASKLLAQQNLTITSKMVRALEQLSHYLPNSSVLSLLKNKALDDETKKKAVAVLADQMELLVEQFSVPQLLKLLDSLMGSKDSREKLTKQVVDQLKDGELIFLLGEDKLVELLTLGVLSGDVKPLPAIPKIFCNSDIVGAACQILKDGASDAQIKMIKAAFPKHVLALWISEIIMK